MAPNFHDYKVIHLLAVCFSLMGLTASLWLDAPSKWLKSFTWSFAFLALTTGIALTYRWNMITDFPLWVTLKYIAWALLFIIHPLILRFKKNWRRGFALAVFPLTAVAVAVSVYKPF